MRALPAVVWIDDQIVGNGIENETLSQITAITFDSSLIREEVPFLFPTATIKKRDEHSRKGSNSGEEVKTNDHQIYSQFFYCAFPR